MMEVRFLGNQDFLMKGRQPIILVLARQINLKQRIK